MNIIQCKIIEDSKSKDHSIKKEIQINNHNNNNIVDKLLEINLNNNNNIQNND